MNQENKSETKFKEGLHYYIEEGNYVFTELYHRERGRCCRNGCRHCPYTIKLQRTNKNLKKD